MRGRGGAIKEEGLSVKCLRNGAPSMESVSFFFISGSLRLRYVFRLEGLMNLRFL